jgi:hypothetical protein
MASDVSTLEGCTNPRRQDALMTECHTVATVGPQHGTSCISPSRGLNFFGGLQILFWKVCAPLRFTVLIVHHGSLC